MKNLLITLGTATLLACNGGSSEPQPAPPASDALLISDIQGAANSSPLNGQTVTFSAIVSGDFQDNDADLTRNLGGFYAQDEHPDSNAMTSDGIFVFDGNTDEVDVGPGDRVEITGRVSEFFGETQITATSVEITGSGNNRVTDVTLPSDGTMFDEDGISIANLERYEGMLLRLPQSLTVTNLRHLERFGEVGLSARGRLFQFTNNRAPNAELYEEYRRSIAARSIVLDDGRRSRYPSSIRHLTAGADADYSIRTGDTIAQVTGNLRFSRGSAGDGAQSWRIMPTSDAVFIPANPRPGVPSIEGQVRVASFNVLNFFSKIDSGQPSCGSRANHNCRGADSDEEQRRQLAKIVAALQMMNADIVGLVELENDADSSIGRIVDALNDRVGEGVFRYLDTGTIGDDAIKTGFIYDTSTIQTRGEFRLLDRSVDSRFDETRHRPALAQTFEVTRSNAIFTVVVNHLKSKGSSCDASGDVNTGDGQGNCNLARTQAAAALAEWIYSDPTNSGDPDFLIVGDLNAYMQEDPIGMLENDGLVNLLRGDTEPYSFVFDGQAGALDHALASPTLADQVVDAMEWHINADEPSVLDYNLENGRDRNLFDATSPYRASDHDPIIVGLDPTD